MGLVLAFGLAFGGLGLWIDSYRSEYLAEQRAIAAIRAECDCCTFCSERIGPSFLIRLAGPGRAREFDRVTLGVCEGSRPPEPMFRAFRHCKGFDSM